MNIYGINIADYLEDFEDNKVYQKQINLFEKQNDSNNENIYLQYSIYVYIINKLYYYFKKELDVKNCNDLFYNIEMPLVEVLADMQYQGINLDKNELIKYGNELKERLKTLTLEIFEIVGEDFNINSPKQLRRNTF